MLPLQGNAAAIGGVTQVMQAKCAKAVESWCLDDNHSLSLHGWMGLWTNVFCTYKNKYLVTYRTSTELLEYLLLLLAGCMPSGPTSPDLAQQGNDQLAPS